MKSVMITECLTLQSSHMDNLFSIYLVSFWMYNVFESSIALIFSVTLVHTQTTSTYVWQVLITNHCKNVKMIRQKRFCYFDTLVGYLNYLYFHRVHSTTKSQTFGSNVVIHNDNARWLTSCLTALKTGSHSNNSLHIIIIYIITHEFSRSDSYYAN